MYNIPSVTYWSSTDSGMHHCGGRWHFPLGSLVVFIVACHENADKRKMSKKDGYFLLLSRAIEVMSLPKYGRQIWLSKIGNHHFIFFMKAHGPFLRKPLTMLQQSNKMDVIHVTFHHTNMILEWCRSQVWEQTLLGESNSEGLMILFIISSGKFLFPLFLMHFWKSLESNW